MVYHPHDQFNFTLSYSCRRVRVVTAHIAVWNDDNEQMSLGVRSKNSNVVEVLGSSTSATTRSSESRRGARRSSSWRDGTVVLTIVANVSPQPGVALTRRAQAARALLRRRDAAPACSSLGLPAPFPRGPASRYELDTMKNRWNDAEAARTVAERKPGVSETPCSPHLQRGRLLGADPSLVLHGGNTSVKAKAETLFGETASDVLHVKGSPGPRDDRAARAPGGPHGAADAPPRASDNDRTSRWSTLRLALLDASAPTPSVEMLFHAALPATFIDHTHADALLAVVDQKNARAIAEEIFGAGLFIPLRDAGLRLARACKDRLGPVAAKIGRTPAFGHGVFRAASRPHLRRNGEGELRADGR